MLKKIKIIGLMMVLSAVLGAAHGQIPADGETATTAVFEGDALKNGDSVSSAQALVSSVAQNCGVVDDFNRADSTNMGANWTERSGDFLIFGNRAVGSNFMPIMTYNGAAGREKACVDFYADPNPSGFLTQYAAIFIKYTSLSDNLFVKVQDNDNNGAYDRIYMYRDGGFPFTPSCGESGLGATSPFTSGRLIAYLDGSNLKADIDTNFDGVIDQSFTCPNAPAKAGTAVGVGIWGPTKLDNFALLPATLVVTKTADTNDGACNSDCSLREAIVAAASGDTIEFASPLFDSAREIQINGQLLITKNLTINGKGANLLTIRNVAPPSSTSSIFSITAGNVALSGMTITGGNGNVGGIDAYNNDEFPRPNLTLTLTGVNVTGNVGFVGGIDASYYNLNIINSSISNNIGVSDRTGVTGGIRVNSDGDLRTLNIINSTVSGNRAPDTNSGAGGIHILAANTNIINSTITDNEAKVGDFRAGGVLSTVGRVTVRNSIIAGNRNNTNSPDVAKLGPINFVSNGNNIIGSVAAGIGFTNGVNNDLVGNSTSPFNPMLAALANNGGPTPTHALLSNSQAINNGNNCVTDLSCSSNNPPFALTADQRGAARTGNVDIGAFEYQPPADSTPPVITPTVTGTLGNNGWYVSDVQVSWSITDNESTVTSFTGCATQTVTSDTAGVTFTCQATSAGGSSSQSVTVKRDAAAPSITFFARTTPNASGWNNSNVAVQWNCADGLSGATSSSVSEILSNEGANQSATGTCADNAGNTAQNTQSGIKIDKTAPTIAFDSRTPPNAAGWNNTNVQVNWNCSDALSGAVNSTVNQTVTSEGVNQSATGTCSDLAGNTASNSQTGIKIDKTAPSITFASRTAPNANGWNNTNVTVNWNCSDTLSGVISGNFNETVSSEGANLTSTGVCLDLAGNTASDTQGGIKIDKTVPTIAFDSRTPPPNANGWNNSNVTLKWNCSDSLSGAANQIVSQTVTSEGANLSAVGTCADLAGNTAQNSQSGIKIDKTAPQITLVSRLPAANANGWNNTNVTVNWSCADALSGATSSTVSQTLNIEGANLSATGACSDVAGNSASNTQSGIKIDKTAPIINPYANITATLPPNSNSSSMAVNFPLPTASDNLSATMVVTNPASGSLFPVGTTIVNVTATDAAGNQAASSFTVIVLYNFSFGSAFHPDRFNDATAGSNLTLMFSLSGNKGTDVYSAAPVSRQINCSTKDQIRPPLPIDAGAPIYNVRNDSYETTWKTKTAWAGTCQQLILSLKDGTIKTLDFRFR